MGGGIVMKPFSLEEYNKNPNQKVVTRDGRNVTIHCTNYDSNSPIIAQIEGAHSSNSFTKEGKFCQISDSKNDLFFATEKREGWINIFKYNFGEPFIGDMYIFRSKEEAEESAKNDRTYVKSIKIEWEEE